MTRHTRLGLSLALGLALVALNAVDRTSATAQAQAQRLQTPAEAVNYGQGGTLYDPLMKFVYELDAASNLMSVRKLTTTLAGRDVVLAVLSNPPIYRPEDVLKTDKPIVLIVNNVHGNEVAGKDASMEIMRDLVQGDLRPLLDDVVVLNIPTINPDGAELRRRTNEQNFDMNRDYLKLESQEIGALVTQVLNVWQPDIWVDTHHGGSAPYALTYQTNMNPAGDQNLVNFGNNEIIAAIRKALRAENYDGFWYSGPGNVNGVAGWTATSVEPRKQHVYGAMANTLGFLFETPSGSHRVIDNGTKVAEIPRTETYRHQVRGQYIGQRELIRFAASRAADVKKVIATAKATAIARGHNDADTATDLIPLEYRVGNKGNEDFWVRSGTAGGGRGAGAGAAGGRAGGAPGQPAAPVTYERVNRPVFLNWEVTRSTSRPWGYFLAAGTAGRVLPMLHDHQITVQRLTAPLSVELEVYYATEITADSYFQGHYLRAVKAEKRAEKMDLPAGTLFVPSGQAKSNLISYLLEPETDDNLITWGYLDDLRRVRGGPPSGCGAGGRAGGAAPDPDDPQPPAAGRGGRGGTTPGQRIPMYRLMKQTTFPAVVVEPAGAGVKNQVYR
jgi:dipeptidyl-peptidase 4